MARQVLIVGLTVAAMAGTAIAQNGVQAPPAVSASKAAAVSTAMKEKKIEVIAGREASAGRFVAAMLIPDVQLMVVSAGYERPTDMDYYLYTKDHLSVYRNLRTNPLAKEQFIVDDADSNGLVALPGKNPLQDRIAVAGTEHVFDGLIADPRRRNSKGVPQDVYMKTFTDADSRYAAILDQLAALVGKRGALAPGNRLR
jgi:hypothetical protein